MDWNECRDWTLIYYNWQQFPQQEIRLYLAIYATVVDAENYLK